jgi:O-antigen chain-terminating methyltransferase
MDELAKALADIERRVNARHPRAEDVQMVAGSVELASLMPAVHARDAALAKIAGIGRVNPRAGGPLNAVIQAAKRLIARGLYWLVRDQVEFNRGAIECVEALMEAHNAHNRALLELASRIETVKQVDLPALRVDQQEFNDIRLHWGEWRRDWERRLTVNEAQFMRSVADLRLAYEQRLSSVEASFGRAMAAQHEEYLRAMNDAAHAAQARFWEDTRKFRHEAQLHFEGLIHQQLRLLRQRPQGAVTPPAEEGFTGYVFADRFRGPEAEIKSRLEKYLPWFDGCSRVLDLGCGRGEFLELVPSALGIDLSPENIRICQAKGLTVEQADLFTYLAQAPDQFFDGVFCGQVIEHLDPQRLPELIRLCAARLKPGSPLIFETPNPECLAIFASHFYIDPTHTRPVPPDLLRYYLEEAGFGQIEILRSGNAANEFPELAQLPEGVRQRFFGALDYAAIARRLP